MEIQRNEQRILCEFARIRTNKKERGSAKISPGDINFIRVSEE
jgi:hypothetical protein